MNYIGSKLSLLSFIQNSIFEVAGTTNEIFCDLFAGTGIVGRHFKKLGYSIVSNDLQYYSYVLNRHYIGNSQNLAFSNFPAGKIFDILNNATPKKGFIFNNYAFGSGSNRLYFSDSNAIKCDSIRLLIEELHSNNSISDNEYFFLLTSLLESIDKHANTASVYAAFLKKLKKSAQKDFYVAPAETIISHKPQLVFNQDANKLIREIKADILYLDPPYNERQYASNYHLLETIAKYDSPVLIGKTGLRDYKNQKSEYCRKQSAVHAFADIIRNANAKYIFLSYNNEGLISFDEIRYIMSNKGKYGYFEQKYNRFKADKHREYSADSTTEYIHWVKCE
ncbi:MAG: DNA adenine methylase [Alphaproteobacteria bacterium]|nr:DNA adenine methylase [Alphaproteobacteria bacterium]